MLLLGNGTVNFFLNTKFWGEYKWNPTQYNGYYAYLLVWQLKSCILPTQYIYRFILFSELTGIISVNSINRVAF
jgi:hypothetical protein